VPERKPDLDSLFGARLQGYHVIMNQPAIRAVLVLFLLLTVPAVGLHAADEPVEGQLARVVGLASTSPFLRERASMLLDGIGPRPAGTPNGLHAEELAAQTFRTAGVPLVFAEPVTVPMWQVHRATLTLVEPTEYEASAVALANAASTPPQGLLLEVIDGGQGTPEEIAALGDAVDNRAVLVRSGVPEGHRRLHRSATYETVARAGAAAFLHAPPDPASPARSGTVTLDGTPGPIPALGISGRVAAWLSRLLREGRSVRVRVTLLADRVPATAHNVVAEIPGRRPEEVILLGAHLDSWDLAQGAGDNGTGTLVLWQVARTLVEQGLRPLRTLRFVSFTGEELGLLGSRSYVERHREELGSIRAMVNLDMVGEPTGFGAMLQPGVLPLLGHLARRLAGFGLDPEPLDRAWLHSDHQPFLLAGVPVITLRSRLREEVRDACHSDRDTIDVLDPGRQQRAAAVVAALAWQLATVEELPTRSLEPAEVVRHLHDAGITVDGPVDRVPGGRRE